MPITSLASLTVVAVGALWGIYWVPLRQLEAVSAAGPWATLAAVLLGGLCLAPFGWAGRSRLATANNRALASVALGGASFVLYSNGLLYGRVAVVILLFYLTPVWSTLIARFWLGWPVSWWRYAAIVCGLAGIALVLRGSHGGLPLPHTLGDFLGLASGLLWAIASTGIHVHVRTRPAETNFVFLAGAIVMAAVLALVLGAADPPRIPVGQLGEALFWTLGIGGLWWGLSLVGFLWATREMEPARVGILLMGEVIVGAVSAALFAGEPFGLPMGLGSALVVAAGFLETLPDRKAGRAAYEVPPAGLTRGRRPRR
ncbi:MAG TPA: DMT family transporter [Gammaproteobacteria bacterium]|nr:DMT family transporter [Gammaproteobacteria bacterium]